MQSRLKSKVFWVAILSAIAMILRAFGVYDLDNATIDSVVYTVFSILTIFGIANNPTNPDGF
jgi:phi LC3 family holin